MRSLEVLRPWIVAGLACVSTSAFSAPPALEGNQRLIPTKISSSTAQELVTGQLAPSKMLPLGFEVGGRLAATQVQKGNIVKAGQLLGSLDTEIIDAQVAQAEAAVLAAEAGSTLASDVADRNEKLKSEGSVSDLQSKQSATQAKAAIAQLQQARAALAQAKAGQRRHFLKAPFGGTIVDAPEQTGGMVGPGAPVYVIMQLDPLVLKATIPEDIRGLILPGMKVRVEAVGSRAFTDDAVVKVVLPSADAQTRRIPIEISVPNAQGQFVANTLGRASLPASSARKAMIIPTTALGTAGGEHVVALIAGGLKRVPVVVLERSSTTVTVSSTEYLEQVVNYPNASADESDR